MCVTLTYSATDRLLAGNCQKDSKKRWKQKMAQVPTYTLCLIYNTTLLCSREYLFSQTSVLLFSQASIRTHRDSKVMNTGTVQCIHCNVLEFLLWWLLLCTSWVNWDVFLWPYLFNNYFIFYLSTLRKCLCVPWRKNLPLFPKHN